MKNIVLFHPRGRPPSRCDIHALACALPPLGLASIAAVLRKAGHRVSIIDAALFPAVDNASWAVRIAGLEPDFVGFSAVTAAFLDAYDVAQRVKKLIPSVRIVFGGVHASWGKAELLRRFDAIDYLVAGEGEEALLRLVSGDDPLSIAGIHLRRGNEIASAPPQSSFCNMDDLPFPAYDLLRGFPRRYLLPLFGYRRHPGANIISSRGCIYQCSYCDRSVFGRSFRWNSAEYTFEQIKWLHRDFGVRHINFYDDLFTLQRVRVERLCGLLAEARLGVRFNCIVRVGHVDDDLIRNLKRGGCWMVNVGIESGDRAILEANKGEVTLDDIRGDVLRLHNAGLWVKGLFMIGFPQETEESIAATRALALSLPLKDANVTAFTPFPGSPIAASIGNYGKLDSDWSKMDCEHFVFVPKTIGSVEKLKELRRQFIESFYRRPAMRHVYWRMLWESPHSYWRLARHAASFLKYAKTLGATQ